MRDGTALMRSLISDNPTLRVKLFWISGLRGMDHNRTCQRVWGLRHERRLNA